MAAIDALFASSADKRWCDRMVVLSVAPIPVDPDFVRKNGVRIVHTHEDEIHVYEVALPSPYTLPRWCNFLHWTYDRRGTGMGCALFDPFEGVRVFIYDW